MTIDKETKCSTGPTSLFPDVPQCPNKPTEYIFHDPYCKECADELREIHKKLNTQTKYYEKQ